MTPTAHRTGRELLRVSVDKSGRERSHEEQHADNLRVATGFGIALGEPYTETGSASRYAVKAREPFEKLLADLEAGRFAEDALVIWESSRGSRRVGEWVELIELCERRGKAILVTTHCRLYDPANPRDRRSMLEDAVDSEYESSKISQRSKRAAAANFEAGKPHGKPPYGYRRRYDPATRKLVAQEPDPVEAPVVRELFERLAKGHSLRSVAKDFEARGIRNRSGTPFLPSQLREMAAMRPSYIGLRTHHETRAERRGPRGLDGAVPGMWPALVDEATFYLVRSKLTDPARKTARPGRGVHLLSMIIRCVVCGGPLAATGRNNKPEYQCHWHGCVRVSKAELDCCAESAMLGYLARPDVHEELARCHGNGEELATARGDVAQARAELVELRAAVASGKLSVASLIAAEPGLIARVESAERRERELATPPALHGLVEPGEDVAERWLDAPMSAKREAVKILIGPGGLLGEMRVAPRPAGSNSHVPAKDRLVWVAREPGAPPAD